MSKQTVRITLRMSDSLHAKLLESSEEGARPLNTEIIRRLENSFTENTRSPAPLTREEVIALIREEMKSRCPKNLK